MATQNVTMIPLVCVRVFLCFIPTHIAKTHERFRVTKSPVELQLSIRVLPIADFADELAQRHK